MLSGDNGPAPKFQAKFGPLLFLVIYLSLFFSKSFLAIKQFDGAKDWVGT
jgi:hypothetical protein